ncbi:cytochrome P450 [Mycobacterium sp. DL99]|uniref:cytochrome P450 n=1 Tax=Mycobacterium sp. DL99 TaxID=2528957 RepID=UPI001080A86D|nr:cytochrome P450 [Mycobacterium sp. DL99]
MTLHLPTEISTRPDIDFLDGTFYANRPDAREAYRWMRANEPVFRDRNGLVGIAGHAAVIEAERRPEVFSNAGGMRPDQDPNPNMVNMDDPGHLLRRKLINSGFTRKRVQDRAGAIDDLCDALIDAVCERGECDFVRDLAAPLPMAVIGDMLGVLPEDRSQLLKWSDDMVSGLSSTVTDDLIQTLMESFTAYWSFIHEMMADRRAHPQDDVVSVLVHAEIDGQRFTDEELAHEILLILIGGDETTRHTLSGGTEQLLRNREQWDELAKNPTLYNGAVEEMLRWTSPVKNMNRTVTSDVDFHGVELSAGQKCLLLFESANFDEAVFAEPDVFDIRRTPNNHVAFGFGTHFCLGNQLARLELSAMTRRLTERLPDLRLSDEGELPLRPANFVSGFEEMPVVFTPTRPLG